MLLQYWPSLQSSEYQHAEILWNNGEIEIYIDGVLALDGTVQAFDDADQIQEGYFGFSASTGLYFDRHSIKNVKVYNNGVDLDQPEMEFASCDLFDGEGMGLFDLTLVEGEMSSTGSYTYHMSEEDAHIGQNAIGNPDEFYNYEPWEQTIYVRIENEEGCFSIGEIHLHVMTSPVPEVEEMTLTLCANQGEEISFDLTLAEADFLAEPDDFVFSYYLSEEDAEEGNDPLEDPEAYSSEGNETIYVRIEEPSAGCYTVVQIHLDTFDPPALDELTDLQACAQDGIFEYDLSLNDPVDSEEGNLVVTYYLSEDDAAAGTNAIENPEEFTLETADCQTIYLRLEAEGDAECYSLGSFEVCGFEAIAGQPNDLFQCVLEEEWGVFDLSLTVDEILDNQNEGEFTIHFYTSEEDALAGENAIENPANYPAESSNQTIYFRMETNGLEGCFAVGNFQIISASTEVVEVDRTLEACAKTLVNLPEWVSGFDLGEILGFYTSMENVLADNPIENPADYRVGETDTHIYVMSTQGETDCGSIYIIPLHIMACDIFIPEGFSPNGDGVNDYFVIDNLEGYPNYKLQIYNRYGMRLFKGNKNTGFWDGNDNKGRKAPSATYYYVLDLGNQTKAITGWVYLNR